MAPARDGAGDDAAPVAPAERAGGSCSGGVSALVSVPWALVVVFFVLTAVFYEDAMGLRMHARRPMFGGLGLTPESVHPARDPADAAAGLGVGRGRRHRVSREEIRTRGRGHGLARNALQGAAARTGVEAARATTLGCRRLRREPPLKPPPDADRRCARVNLGCDAAPPCAEGETSASGPELRRARDDLRARARWDDSPTTKDPTSGEVVFDGEALEAATKGPRMRIVEMEERVGGEGFVDEDEGANR